MRKYSRMTGLWLIDVKRDCDEWVLYDTIGYRIPPYSSDNIVIGRQNTTRSGWRRGLGATGFWVKYTEGIRERKDTPVLV